MYNLIIIPPLSSLCISPSPLGCRLAEIQKIVVVGVQSGASGRLVTKMEVWRRGQKRSDHWNYEEIRSKKWKRFLWHSVWFTQNYVDLHRKYTRMKQDKQKWTIIRPRPDLFPQIPSWQYYYLILPIVVHFTVSDVKFLGPARFLKKLFHCDYYFYVSFHFGVR